MQKAGDAAAVIDFGDPAAACPAFELQADFVRRAPGRSVMQIPTADLAELPAQVRHEIMRFDGNGGHGGTVLFHRKIRLANLNGIRRVGANSGICIFTGIGRHESLPCGSLYSEESAYTQFSRAKVIRRILHARVLWPGLASLGRPGIT